MEPDAIVDNLVFLSTYLEESRGRVSELEEELENMVCPRVRFCLFSNSDARSSGETPR
jgi:hypothetical protein